MKRRRGATKAASKVAKARAPRRPHGGVRVNPELRLPRPPGGWVDETRNYVTGERFEDFRPGITWDDGVRLLRQEARRQGIAGGGYRSRGPVLWAMHVLRLERWYERAMGDGALWDPIRRRPLELRARRTKKVKRRAASYKPDARWGF